MPLSKRLVIFAPHPDDETLGCGGTIIKRLEEGYEVFVVVITDGRHAYSCKGVYANPAPEELKEIRKAEAVNAMKVLGVPRANLLFWDFEDRALKYDISSFAEKSIGLLNKLQPAEMYIPSEKDSNKDHRIASQVLENCFSRLSFPCNCYKYSVAQKFLHLGPIWTRFINLFKGNLVFVETFEVNALKAAALHEFKSQKKDTKNERGPATLNNTKFFLKKREVFVRVEKSLGPSE